jgi:opacity protein-like surface antigen
MKKLIVSLAALLIASAISFNANAEGFVVKGGLNYTHLDFSQSLKDQAKALALDVKSYSGFHAGVGYQTEDILGFTLQPEVLYSRKGVKLGDQVSWAMNYIEIPCNIQWGIDLVALRPFVQLSPYMGFGIGDGRISGSKSTLNDRVYNFIESFSKDANKFSYGIGIGGGIELMRKFQISAKYVWNFGHVADVSDYVNQATNVKRDTASGLEVSIALLF